MKFAQFVKWMFGTLCEGLKSWISLVNNALYYSALKTTTTTTTNKKQTNKQKQKQRWEGYDKKKDLKFKVPAETQQNINYLDSVKEAVINSVSRYFKINWLSFRAIIPDLDTRRKHYWATRAKLE